MFLATVIFKRGDFLGTWTSQNIAMSFGPKFEPLRDLKFWYEIIKYLGCVHHKLLVDVFLFQFLGPMATGPVRARSGPLGGSF